MMRDCERCNNTKWGVWKYKLHPDRITWICNDCFYKAVDLGEDMYPYGMNY